MVKVSEKNRHLASYLKQNEVEFIDWVEGTIDPAFDINVDKLAEIIQEFYDELC